MRRRFPLDQLEDPPEPPTRLTISEMLLVQSVLLIALVIFGLACYGAWHLIYRLFGPA